MRRAWIRLCPPFAASVVLAACAGFVLAACAAPAPATRASGAETSASAVGGSYLYRLPQMRAARRSREIGARELERAYAARRAMDQEARFRASMEAFGEATEHYHAALLRAPDRYHAVIEGEVETVAGYMRQIQRDRAAR